MRREIARSARRANIGWGMHANLTRGADTKWSFNYREPKQPIERAAALPVRGGEEVTAHFGRRAGPGQ